MKPILLDRNENHYGPAPACVDVLTHVGVDLLHDYSRDFLRGHYSSLSERLAQWLDVDEKHVALGYGCEDLLNQAFQHFIRPGQRCFLPSASWWYYRSLADEVRSTVIEYPMIEQHTEYVFDVDRLVQLHAQTPARLLVISSPNNPTGNSFPRERLEEVLDHFRDAIVVLDEAYWGFLDENDTDCLAGLTHRYPNLLVLRTFSKLHALAGVRIGYGIAGRGPGMDGFLKSAGRNLGYNRISELLALAAIESPDYYYEIRKCVAQDRERLYEALAPIPGVRAYRSDANFALIRIPGRVKEPLRNALTSAGVHIKFFVEPAFHDCARITMGTADENALLRDLLVENLSGLLGEP